MAIGRLMKGPDRFMVWLLCLSLSLFWFLLTLLWLVCRGLPGGNLLFFASPKKSKQKKGDPQSGALRFALGNLCWSKKAGVELELACGSDNRSP